ncbi:MAG: hypothetical protein JNM31_01795 [Flavobacteriales bacterium]|nr:hypothetical protein [Flavobacteriales bacterium]
MELKVVEDKRTLRDWMELPWQIYRNDANWIPHLRQDIEKVFDPERNKLLRKGKGPGGVDNCIRWVLYDALEQPMGRIAAFINHKTAWTERQPTGGIGFFECRNDPKAAQLLFDTARDWLKDKGMEAMDGPVNLGDRNMYWGLLIENFKDAPIYGANYNPPYYKDLFEAYGFQIYFNQLFFKRSAETVVQPIFHRKYQQLVNDPDIRMHDGRGRTLQQIATDFCTVYNDAWVDHVNHKPMEPATALKIVKAMAPVMDRRLLIFIRHKDRPIAVYISLPELNEIFRFVNGNLNWWGKLKFVWHKWRGAVKNVTGIVFGVAKDWQGKGIEGALIVYGEQMIVKPGHYKDTILTWVGDFNPKMIKVCRNLEAVNYRTLATYRYLFDRSRPFERHPIIDKKENRS